MTDTYLTLAIAFVVSFSISYGLTPIVRHLAIRFGYVDDPKRNHPAILHTVTIPRAGGVAMFIAFVITVILFAQKDLLLVGISVGSLITVVIGTLDDKYDLSPLLRLGFQFLSALIVTFVGVQIYISNPLGDGILYFDWLSLSTLPFNLRFTIPGDVILIFWIVMLMNTTNWTKGASQLPGVAVIAFLTIAAVALKYQAGNEYQLQTAMLSVIMSGAVLAFLPFNFPPERMFPGFGASTFIGFMLAVLSVLSGGKVAVIFIVFGVPILDAVLVGTRRILQHTNPTEHDNQHLYHLLLKRGWSKQQIIFGYLLLTALLGVAATLSLTYTKLLIVGLIFIVVSGVYVLLYRSK